MKLKTQAKSEAAAPATPATPAPDWKPRAIKLEADLQRAASWSNNQLAEVLLGLVRAIIKLRQFQLLERAEGLGAVVLGGETDVTLLRARMAALQVDLGRAAENG